MLTGYKLDNDWLEFYETNPDKIKPQHHALFTVIKGKWNRLKQPERFGLPTYISMEHAGIRSWRCYKKTLQDLVSWGFVQVIQESRNQYSAAIITLFDRAENAGCLCPTCKSKLDQCLCLSVNGKGNGTVRGTAAISKPVKTVNEKPSTSIEVGADENFSEIFSEPPPPQDPHSRGEKRKKPSAQKKKKDFAPPQGTQTKTPYWKELVQVWHQFNFTQFHRRVSFRGRDPKCLQLIMQLLQQHSEAEGREWTQERALQALQQFLEGAITDPWLKMHFLLSNLSNQFDIIYAKTSSYDNSKISNGNKAHFAAHGRNGAVARLHSDDKRYRDDYA